jgi:CheY-like chemotaxis protein
MISQKKILIVDDNAVFVKAVSILLKAKGYQAFVARDGARAISTVRQEKPDLILLDINFPPDVAHGGGVNWDGFRIMEWLRRMDEGKGVPIILVTAGDPAKEQARCRAFELAGFFRKPVDNNRLLETIRKALDGKPRPKRLVVKLPKVKKILFVDDEDDWRYMVTAYLTDSGYEVLTAANGVEALRQAERVTPDLVVLDLNLGGESGLPVMRRLKAKLPKTPVLLYTGMENDEEAVQAMMREGAHQYLRKGTMEDMVRAIELAAHGLTRPKPKPAAEKKARESTDLVLEPHPETVLLLEDDAAFAETLKGFLEAHSFLVTRVANGVEGLRQLAATEFDIILCDMVLPNLRGDQFYGAVECTKPQLCNRFIFMTDHPDDPVTEKFISRVQGFLLWKPFPFADLLTAIEDVAKQIPAAGNRSSVPTAV